jgi:murein DD-endopeptidase MepM/ murein hydrolase activator NlpD
MNYFDIIGVRFFDDNGKVTFFNSQDGKLMNYDGSYSTWFYPNPYIPGYEVHPGVGDSHTGLDYIVPIGNYIISGSPTSEVFYLPHQNGEYRVHIWFADPDNRTNLYATTYGHLEVQLVSFGQKIYRGQIIGLSGDTGKYSGGYPQLHFDLANRIPNGWKYIDPYRYTVRLDPLPQNFAGSDVSYWIKDNDPQFSWIESVE